jgi:hypothetical protein
MFDLLMFRIHGLVVEATIVFTVDCRGRTDRWSSTIIFCLHVNVQPRKKQTIRGRGMIQPRNKKKITSNGESRYLDAGGYVPWTDREEHNSLKLIFCLSVNVVLPVCGWLMEASFLFGFGGDWGWTTLIWFWVGVLIDTMYGDESYN